MTLLTGNNAKISKYLFCITQETNQVKRQPAELEKTISLLYIWQRIDIQNTQRTEKGNIFADLNENSPHRLIYLTTWSPVGVNVWDGLGGMVILEICH